ncbi:MAG TPA: histidine phosphatase family protein [Bacteroidetes bacterium]|nr:histidine phosphatase family protein [Bacteroidota bacterium]
MKKLYLLRHAKSSWGDAELKDFNRPLDDRGFDDARLIGKRLHEADPNPPDLIMASPAKRAATTARLIADELGYLPDDIRFHPGLYLASVPGLLEVLHSTEDSVDKMLVVGHNPGLTDLTVFLTDYLIDNIPTCGLFCIETPVQSWQQLERRCGTVTYFDYPKKIS